MSFQNSYEFLGRVWLDRHQFGRGEKLFGAPRTTVEKYRYVLLPYISKYQNIDWFIFSRSISKKFICSPFVSLLYSVFQIPNVHSRNKMSRTFTVSDLQLVLHCAQRNKMYFLHFVKKFTFILFQLKGVYDI